MSNLQPLLEISLSNVRLHESDDFVVGIPCEASIAHHFAEPVEFLAVGVGAAGCNALSKMNAAASVPCLAVTADSRVYATTSLTDKILVGTSLLQGGGSKGQRELVQEAVSNEDVSAIGNALAKKDLVVIVAGMAKGTGGGLAPLLAEQANEAEAFSLGVAVMPFDHQGFSMLQRSQEALASLNRECSAVITFHNEAVSHRHPHAGSKELLDRANDSLSVLLLSIKELASSFAAGNQTFGDFKNHFASHASLMFATASVDANASAKEQIDSVLSASLTGHEIGGANQSIVFVVSQNGLSAARQERMKTQMCAATGNVRHKCLVVERYDANMDHDVFQVSLMCPVTYAWSKDQAVLPVAEKIRPFVRPVRRHVSLVDAISERIGQAIATPPASEEKAEATASSGGMAPTQEGAHVNNTLREEPAGQHAGH